MTGLPGSGLRAALVGCGRIAPAHLQALRAAGFDVRSIVGRPGSPNAATFAGNHGIPTVHESVDALCGDAWDVAVVAVPIEDTVTTVHALASTGRVLLVEKPVGLTVDAIGPLDPWAAQLIVGYNRRHYQPVRRLASLIAEHGPALVELALPERIPGSAGDKPRERQFIANSTHGLDLVLHLLGPLHLVETLGVGASRERAAVGALLHADDGHVVQLTANWNAPDNFRLACNWDGLRYELRPFEVGRLYEGMAVIEPTPAMPVRRYEPTVVEEVVAVGGTGLKPGFAEQVAELAGLARGEPPRHSARLADAAGAVDLAEQLLHAAG